MIADDDVAQVSLVGAGMKTHPGVTATMFETLADGGINIEMISTSPIRISCMVRAELAEKAVQALHDGLRPRRNQRRGTAPVALAARCDVGIFGATGQVGGVMRARARRAGFPVDEVRSSPRARSAGRTLAWAGDATSSSRTSATADFAGSTSPCSPAASNASLELAPRVAAAGAIVIDNSSAWRMDPDVPLVVPEVNGRGTALDPEGDRRQPELHDDGGDAGPEAARTTWPGCAGSSSRPTRRSPAPGWPESRSSTSRSGRSRTGAAR